ncbi:Uncharacterised protein [Segatella copri]|nr:Uncharacterised protein [Segatella copri]
MVLLCSKKLPSLHFNVIYVKKVKFEFNVKSNIR